MMSPTRVLSIVATAALLAACGAGDDAAVTTTPDTSESIDPAVPPTSPPDSPTVTFLSEPVPAGPMFGSGSSATSESSDADTEVDVPEDCDDEQFLCEDLSEVPVTDAARPAFVPAPPDEPFCSLLAEMETRPFPSDDIEALIVANAWFDELRPTVIDSRLADFDLLHDWLRSAAASQGQMDADDVPLDLDAAGDRLDEYVDVACFGIGEDDVEPPVTTDQPSQ